MPPDSPVLRVLIKRARKKLSEALGFCIPFRDCIYSLVNIPDVPSTTVYGGEGMSTAYQLTATWVQQIGRDDLDMLIFFKIFLNRLMERGGLIQVGFGKYFDPTRARSLKQCH